MTQEYIPGVCNIGPAEIKRRKIFSFIGYALFFIFLIVFIVFDIDPIFRLSLAFPAFYQSINYLQVVNKFCASFGLTNVFNFSDKLDNTTKVEKAEFIQKDREKALKIIGLSILISILAGIAGYLTSYINFNYLL
jgi:hypothetical protein